MSEFKVGDLVQISDDPLWMGEVSEFSNDGRIRLHTVMGMIWQYPDKLTKVRVVPVETEPAFKVGDKVIDAITKTVQGTVEMVGKDCVFVNWDSGVSQKMSMVFVIRVEDEDTFNVGDRVREPIFGNKGTVTEILPHKKYKIAWDDPGVKVEIKHRDWLTKLEPIEDESEQPS